MTVSGPVFLYIRVSTEEQSKEGYSVAAQEKVLRAWCTLKGYDQVELFSDPGYSAGNMRRPALTDMLARVRQGGVRAVLIWKLDRLSRSLKDTLHILEDILQPAGTELVSTSESIDTSTPSGRLMINVLASFAQAERENTQERIRMVSAELAKMGRHMGGVPPFGYLVKDGSYVLDEPAAQAVRTLFDMFITGQGYAAMADFLRQGGFKTTRGNDFSKASLHDIMRNEKYTGTYIWNRSASATRSGQRNHHQSKPKEEIIRIPNAFPAIIDQATWRKAQDTIRTNRVHAGSYTAKQVYLLSGIIFCESCGRRMTIRSGSTDRDGTVQRYYACPNKCVKAARKEQVEGYVLAVIQAYLMNEDIILRAARIAGELMAEDSNGARRPLIQGLQDAIHEVDQQLSGIAAFIAANGAQAPATLITQLEQLEHRKRNLQLDLQAAQVTRSRIDGRRIIATLRASVQKTNRPLEQKAAIQRAVRRVSVSDQLYRVSFDCSAPGGGEPNPIAVQSEIERPDQRKTEPIYNISVTCVTNVTYSQYSQYLPIFYPVQLVTLYVTQFNNTTNSVTFKRPPSHSPLPSFY